MTRADIKRHARGSLSGHWGVAIGVLLLQGILNGVCNAILPLDLGFSRAVENALTSVGAGVVIDVCDTLASIPGLEETIGAYYTLVRDGITLHPLSLLLSFALSVGVAGAFLTLVRGEKPRWTALFDGFRLCLLHAVLAGLLIKAVTTVGSLLLVVPGVIAGLGLSQTAYLLRDQPELTCIGAMKTSWKLMEGHKLELFVLQLSFFGWNLLCLLILPRFYVTPYKQATYAAYHDFLTGRLSRADAVCAHNTFTGNQPQS